MFMLAIAIFNSSMHLCKTCI